MTNDELTVDQLLALAKQLVAEKKALVVAKAVEEKQSALTKKIKANNKAGDINARVRRQHKAAHWNAKYPNYDPRKYRSPSEESKIAHENKIAEGRLITCDCHKQPQKEGDVIYCQPHKLEPPKWICRSIANKFGWGEYTVQGTRSNPNYDRRTTPPPNLKSYIEEKHSTIPLKLKENVKLPSGKVLKANSILYAGKYDERGYIVENADTFEGNTFDLVLKIKQVQSLKR